MKKFLELGALHFNRGEIEPALACWLRAAELDPQRAQTHLWLAKAYRKKGAREQAVAACEKALALDARQFPAYRILAAAHFDAGRLDAATSAYRRWLALAPDAAAARFGLAEIEKRRGGVKEAAELLLPLAAAENADVKAVAEYASVCNRLDPPPPEALPILEKWADREGLEAMERVRIVRGLARLYDALGRYDEAFRRMQQARRLQSAQFGGNEKALFRGLADTARHYSAERLARLPRASHRSELPVFILGMPRSGTTLVEQVLASHPRAHGAGELTHIIRYARVLGAQQPYPGCLDALTQKRVNALAAEYLGRLRLSAPAALRVSDKMPFNFLHLGLIELLLPRARVIHCVRDPLDTCVSCYFNEFPDGLSIAHDLGALGRYYRGYRELMRHWRTVLRLPMLEVSYEALVHSPEEHIRRIVAFAGLEWDDACLRFHETRRQVLTTSYHQVSRPIYTGSIGRHQAYERHLGALREALGSELQAVSA